MTIKHYRYAIAGTDRDGQSWRTHGDFLSEFPDIFQRAMQLSFIQLTKGDAVYGQPGRSCKGPYDIRVVRISQIKK